MATAIASVPIGHNVYRGRATGTGNIDHTLTPGVAFKLLGFRLHLSAVGAANSFTASFDAGGGAAYDYNVLTKDMTAVANASSGEEHYAAVDDVLAFAWTNGSSRTWGLDVFWSPI